MRRFVPAILGLLTLWSTANAQDADIVYTNGKIYTVNEKQPWAEAVAIKDGKFIAVGSGKDVKQHVGEKTEVVDLGGMMVMPGLIDAHHHLLTVSDGFSHLKLNNDGGRDGLLKQIKEYAEANPDLPLVRGEQWNLGIFPDNSPRKELLDEIIPNRPAYMMSQTGHSAWVNSKALEMAGITKDTPVTQKFIYDKDSETGEPTGTIREFAMAAMLQKLPRTPLENMLG